MEIDFESATQLIDRDRTCWDIELLCHIVKNACRIEALQRSRVERLERAIALYPVVAWRIARLMRWGRSCPDLPAELFFEPEEWKAAHVLLKKEERWRTRREEPLAQITARRRLRHRLAICP